MSIKDQTLTPAFAPYIMRCGVGSLAGKKCMYAYDAMWDVVRINRYNTRIRVVV